MTKTANLINRSNNRMYNNSCRTIIQIYWIKRTIFLQLTCFNCHLFVSWVVSTKNKALNQNFCPIKTYPIQAMKVVYRRLEMMRWALVTTFVQTPTSDLQGMINLSLPATRVVKEIVVSATMQTCLSPQAVKNSKNTKMIARQLISPQQASKNRPMTITRSNRCSDKWNGEESCKKISWGGLLWTKKSRLQSATSLASITAREGQSSSRNKNWWILLNPMVWQIHQDNSSKTWGILCQWDNR